MKKYYVCYMCKNILGINISSCYITFKNKENKLNEQAIIEIHQYLAKEKNINDKDVIIINILELDK